MTMVQQQNTIVNTIQQARPFFTVVIPLYNKEQCIKRTLRSVLSQTFQDFEVIVVDDGSTDRGPEYVNAIGDSRIRLFQQTNAGVSSARNRGIKEAKADYITFLDADDEWSSDLLQTIMHLINSFPSAGLFATSYTLIAGNIVRKTRLPRLPDSWEGLLSNYFEIACGGDPPICSSAVCVPLKIFLKSGGFQEGVFSGEDLLLWATIALNHSVAYSNKSCANYYRNILHNVHDTYIAENHRADWVQFKRQAIERNLVGSDLSSYVNWQLFLQAKACALNGQGQEARDLLTKCTGPYILIKRTLLALFSYIPFALSRLFLPFYYAKSGGSSSRKYNTTSNEISGKIE